MKGKKYTLTLFEVCDKLNRSRRAISRYIRVGLLHPIEVKSRQGTKEYRFNPDDVEAFRARNNVRQEETRRGRTDETRQDTDLDTPSPLQLYVSESFSGDETGSDRKRREEMGQESSREKAVPIKEGSENIDLSDEIGRDEKRQDSREETRKDETGPIVELLKETVSTFKIQLEVKDQQISAKDEQINKLIERNREMNILIGNLQRRVFLLEGPEPKPVNNSRKNWQAEEPEVIEIVTEAVEPAEVFIEGKREAPQEAGPGESKPARPRNNRKRKTEDPEGKTEKKAEDSAKKEGFWKKLWS